ncbi:MAG: response regulator [Planctomycetes bacterium]|nr:response regulator [Planctomycetota bacterium]
MEALPPIQVLLVEDDPAQLETYKQMLGGYEEDVFEVTPARTLADAVRQMRERGFDVVLLDLTLPDSRGLDTVSAVQEVAPHLPILVLTGWDADELAVKAIERGAQDCLQKGRINIRLLRRALRYAIERKKLMGQLLGQNARLKELDRLKNEFVSFVSHQLRTPVTAMEVALSLMESKPPKEPAEDHLENLRLVRRNVDRLRTLINDVLDISRIESGRLRVELQETDLGVLALETLDLLRPLARQRQARLSTDLRRDVLWVQCDPQMIGQVLSNLVSNALVHNEPGVEVQIGAESLGSRVRLWVRDNGVGLDAEDQERIFLPYYQINRRRARGQRATSGLGLPIAKGLVEAHQSRMNVTSKPGGGCVFSFELAQASALLPQCEQRESWALPGVQVSADRYGPGVRFCVAGPLTLETIHGITEIAHRVMRNWSPHLAVDLESCSKIDSRGIGSLVEWRAIAQSLSGSIVLLHVPPRIRRVLDEVGLGETLPGFGTLQAALLALASGNPDEGGSSP